jgi:hypothetical protein
VNQGAAPEILMNFSRFVRFSAVGRYSRLYGGFAYPETVIAHQSYLAQASLSIADYETSEGKPPRWEFEFVASATPVGALEHDCLLDLAVTASKGESHLPLEATERFSAGRNLLLFISSETAFNFGNCQDFDA